jgi:hypothetical protein
MKRVHALALALSVCVLCVGSIGCARQASSQGQKRLAEPSMAEPVGSPGLSRDSKAYIANDPP